MRLTKAEARLGTVIADFGADLKRELAKEIGTEFAEQIVASVLVNIVTIVGLALNETQTNI